MEKRELSALRRMKSMIWSSLSAYCNAFTTSPSEAKCDAKRSAQSFWTYTSWREGTMEGDREGKEIWKRGGMGEK